MVKKIMRAKNRGGKHRCRRKLPAGDDTAGWTLPRKGKVDFFLVCRAERI